MPRLLSASSLLLAALLLYWLDANAVLVGRLAIPSRALLSAAVVILGLVGVRPWLSPFLRSPTVFAGFFVIPLLFFVALYFFLLLPQREGEGIRGEQILSALITDASSNGIVEVGFSYPIYTPTIELRNAELFTREVELFLRVLDARGDSSLYRAVRDAPPGSALSVEASVKGLLSESEEYVFNPLSVAPLGDLTGKAVFVITNLEEGTSLRQALREAQQAQFELREIDSGELIDDFPLIQL
jgi:hypothetical protein